MYPVSRRESFYCQEDPSPDSSKVKEDTDRGFKFWVRSRYRPMTLTLSCSAAEICTGNSSVTTLSSSGCWSTEVSGPSSKIHSRSSKIY